MGNSRSIRNTVIAGVVGVMFVSALCAAGDRDKGLSPRDVTLTGKIVDLQSFMSGKFTSSDKVKCTRECIRAGVPIAIETEMGLIVVGEGTKGSARTLAPFAFQYAELKGKLYDKHGLRYIDITSAKAVKPKFDPVSEQDEEDVLTPDPEEMISGACCMSDQTCIDTDMDDCSNRAGAFYSGLNCEDVDCE